MPIPQEVAHRMFFNLSREIETIYEEMDRWSAESAHKLKAHERQLLCVQTWTKELGMKRALGQLRRFLDRDAFWIEKGAHLRRVQALVAGAREVWEFYRDRFHLYYGPLKHYEKWVEGAEWVAEDCCQTALQWAQCAHLVSGSTRWVSPLLQLSTAETKIRPKAERDYSSPYTTPRRYGRWAWPIPIIVLPANLMASTWGFLALHHEVGHDVDGDLGHELASSSISDLAATNISMLLVQRGVPGSRIGIWCTWLSELFADFFAVLTAGPAFVGYMIDMLAGLPEGLKWVPQSSYPPEYLRVCILIRLVKTMGQPFEAVAATYQSLWDNIWMPDRPSGTTIRAHLSEQEDSKELAGYFDDIDHVITAVVDEPLACPGTLQTATLRSLNAYTETDHEKVLSAADALTNGGKIKKYTLPPRLIPSAARIAFERIMATPLPEKDLDQVLEELNERVLMSIRANRPETTIRAPKEGYDQLYIEAQYERARRFREAILHPTPAD